MYFDRKALKMATKAMVNRGEPKGWLVTLVYMVATLGATGLVSYFSGLLLEGPMAETMAIYNASLERMLLGEAMSESAANALLQALAGAMSSGWVLAALLISLIVSFYIMVVQVGYFDFTLRRVRGQQEFEYRELFDWFYMAGKIIWLNVLQMILIFLWSLLFYIPGLVASYRYRMALYCLIDDPDISALEAIRRSKKLMQGKKGELFVLDLSFLGWIMLASMATSAVVGSTMLLPGVVMTVINLAAECLIMMHLNTYVAYTNAGFYLFTLRKPAAPPVEERPMGFDPAGQPENPFDKPVDELPPSDEDWMK